MSCLILGAAVLLLGIKLYTLKKSAKEIKDGLEEKLSEDTNTLIDISSRDKDMSELAASLNRQLKQLTESRHTYEQGDSELKQAVTNISHDLRTPLTAICGYLDLLEREQQSDNGLEYIKIIKNRTEAMKKLTEELFRYSVIMAKEQELEIKPIALNDVLEESIAAFYAVLTDSNIKPKIDITEKKIVRNVDRSALSRVFANLLNNAVKYSDGDLDIALSGDGEIMFSNTASGLDEVQVGRLFERFYTVEAARQSTGLGLSIAKALVEEMNGEIEAEYVKGRVIIKIIFQKTADCS
ncbi:MAG: HAMP domain-containing histidine kinase [Ruminococcaceae bacterium]|nr:HAMP domain-containing histidine kinase [Oscillospiraceae bacterium]MBD5116597.1 HAMP domain-containing histidine kinase [Oscillospiraceae bacterium]